MENQTSFHNRSLCTQAQGAELQDEPAPDPPTWVPSSHQDPGRYRISEGASKNNDFLRQRRENTWELREAAPAPWEAAGKLPKVLPKQQGAAMPTSGPSPPGSSPASRRAPPAPGPPSTRGGCTLGACSTLVRGWGARAPPLTHLWRQISHLRQQD